MSFLEEAFSLAGRTALVTGARRGIGQAVAVAFARAGADVILLARDSRLEETVGLLAEAGCRPRVVEADLAEPEAAGAAVRELVQSQRVDILVNNAGTILRADAADYSYADWQTVVNINQNSTWLISQEAGRPMVERGAGKIINIASLLSFQGGIRVPAYTASKHAVAGITKALANEWAGSGVQVNAIAPGYIATDNTTDLRADAGRSQEILARIPAGRWGNASDIAGTAVFLAGPGSDYINGHILPVDGGWLAR